LKDIVVDAYEEMMANLKGELDPPITDNSTIKYITNDNQIKSGMQNRLIKKAKKILRGTGINAEKYRDKIINLMLAENYRSETLTMVRTLEFAINALVDTHQHYGELADKSINEKRIIYLCKSQGIKEGIEFLSRLKKVKEAQL
jgi:hypothetical protein